MIEKTYTVGGVTFTLARATVKHRITRTIILRKIRDGLEFANMQPLSEDELLLEIAYQYASFIAQAKFHSDAKWACSAGDAPNVVLAALFAFTELDALYYDEIANAVAAINAPAVQDEKKA